MDEALPKHLRLISSTWIAVIGWILLVVGYAEPVVTGRWQIMFDYAPGMAAIAWLLFVFFWAPRLVVDLEHVSVRNTWMTTTVPYPRIDDVNIGLLVKIKYRDNADDQRSVVVWNAPGLPKITKSFGSPDTNEVFNPLPNMGKRPGHSVDQNYELQVFGESNIAIEMWQEHLSDPDAPVERKVHWITIVITALFAVLLAVKLWL